MTSEKPDSKKVETYYRRLKEDAEGSGYHLNPDREFTEDLVESLIINTERYGYPSCPCRLAEGTRAEDLDIICPCDYRDPDLNEFGACYCALYVSEEVAAGDKEVEPIPERRPAKEERDKKKKEEDRVPGGRGDTEEKGLPYPVHRCKVCGYLCARDEPPERCPICGAAHDRFERFM